MELNPADDRHADEVRPDRTPNEQENHGQQTHSREALDEAPSDSATDGAVSSDDRDDRAAGQLDLDVLERELEDVETALTRLDDGTYWIDEVTGRRLPDDLLADQPTARTSSAPRPPVDPSLHGGSAGDDPDATW